MKILVQARNVERHFGLNNGERINLKMPSDVVIGDLKLAEVDKTIRKLEIKLLKEYARLKKNLTYYECLDDVVNVASTELSTITGIVEDSIRDINFAKDELNTTRRLKDFMTTHKYDTYELKNQCTLGNYDLDKLYQMYDSVEIKEGFVNVELGKHKLTIMKEILLGILNSVMFEEDALDFYNAYVDNYGNIQKVKHTLFGDNSKYRDTMVRCIEFLSYNDLYMRKDTLFDTLIESVHYLALGVYDGLISNVARFLVSDILYRDTSRTYLLTRGIAYNGKEEFDAHVDLKDDSNAVICKIVIPVRIK